MNPKSKRFLFFFCLISLLFVIESQQKETLAQDGEGHILYLPIVSKAPGTLAISVFDDVTMDVNIFTINSDGTNLKQLTDTPYGNHSFDWSPDGQKIVFASYRDRDYEIYVMNVDGSGQLRLTYDLGWDNDPAWSPDGTKIAFVSDRHGWYSQLNLMNPDGTDIVRLTHLSIPFLQPIWSPDGKKIALYDTNYNQSEIYIYDLTLQKLIQVTENSYYDRPIGWSPDSKKLLYLSNSTTGGVQDNYDIFVMHLEGTKEIHQLTEGGHGFHAVYSPDGSQIIFNGYFGEEYGAFFARADNYSITPFVCSNDLSGFPWIRQQWSSDGKTIAFTIGGINSGIGIMDYRDRTCKQIASISMIYDLQWRPKP